MTYKEVLFKMAKRGFLSLSNDKESSGLFWVGISNRDALEKEFDLKDLEGEDPPEKEYYIDRQGKKQEKIL